MKFTELSIKNYRSIKEIENAKISSFQAFIGENNVGKSNVLYAVDIFLSAGSGGVKETDFNISNSPIVIKMKFSVRSDNLKRIWRPYMINDDLILEKHIWIDRDTGKLENEYHGYKAEPSEWYLSTEKIIESNGNRPNWKDIVEENSLPDYFLNNDNCNKNDYTKGLKKYLIENDVEYEEPDISRTQALGLQSNVIKNLPKFYLLRAESNYSDETDKRSSSTTFRKLMGDLTDRIVKNDPKYREIEEALNKVDNLLNSKIESEEEIRLSTLSLIEKKIKGLLEKLMPSVESVKLKVVLDDIKSIFSKGVELLVDDGVETDVLLKGHGMQRCIIFSLLQALILNERNQFINNVSDEDMELISPIILGIEEPELYIHPQLGKLFYDVLSIFSKKDQVIYTTHSPRFIDVYEYESIAYLTKTKDDGTKFMNCKLEAFDGLDDKKIFKGLTQLNTDVNELFFSKNVILVEGPGDKIAITETLKKLGIILTRTEEKDVTIIVTGGKQSIKFFARVLNAFTINYSVLHDLDISDDMNDGDKRIHERDNNEINRLAINKVVTFPLNLESTLNLPSKHFSDQYNALKFFTEHENINSDLEDIIKKTFEIISIEF